MHNRGMATYVQSDSLMVGGFVVVPFRMSLLDGVLEAQKRSWNVTESDLGRRNPELPDWTPRRALRDLEKQLSEQPELFWVALDKTTGDVIGFVGYYPVDGKNWSLEGVDVVPEERSKGIGTTLVRQVLSHARRTEARVVLRVRQDNLAAIRTYEKAGMRRTGREGEDLIYASEQAEG